MPEQAIRFAAFELKRDSGELRKRGIKIKLQGQPVQILILLVDHAGETVSRAEIRDRLWPGNTFVDFDNAISSGVRKIREALSDNPDSPRFVETVARHGYRFVCPVSKYDEPTTVRSPVEPVWPISISSNAQAEEKSESALNLPQTPSPQLNTSLIDELVIRNSKLEAGDESVFRESQTTNNQNTVIRPRRGTDIASKLVMIRACWAFVVLLALISAWLSGRRAGSLSDGNPLSNATFARFTDFPGDKTDASISPDGKFVAFRADRDGRSDVWVSQVGTGRFVNLTNDQPEDPILPISNLGFSPDGSQIWLAGYRPNQRLRLIPLMGGAPRPFLRDHTANVAWSPDGSRVAFHTYEPGDPMFVADGDGANARQIFALGPGGHNHFLAWSTDARWIYFVSGPWESLDMDVWRIPATGGLPERMTRHNADVRSVVPISPGTILYISPQRDGSGPWLWALDVESKISRRVSIGLEHYISVSGSAKAHRLVAAVSNPMANLWSVPILERPATEADIKPYKLPNDRALAPRFVGNALFYLSAHGSGDGLWRYLNGQAFEIWKGAEGPLLVPPAISSDATAAVIVLSKLGKLVLYRISTDGAEIQPLTTGLDVRGAPSWSPDGRWIITGGQNALGAGLFKIPAEGGTPIRLSAKPGINPVWSPDGKLIVYAGNTVSRTAPLLAIRPDGSTFELPPIVVGAGRGINRAHHRFTPDGKRLIYLRGLETGEDFWYLDLATRQTKLLARLGHGISMSFDVTPDGRQIVLDRIKENSELVLIDLPN
ncbi:MAG TPA: winged helix-turn-helix domain-containing protein [Bryobacteraceae bacterium]|nr:winged helix-turn-helix domain-containing protein [Bryobacteraceae bacterium]